MGRPLAEPVRLGRLTCDKKTMMQTRTMVFLAETSTAKEVTVGPALDPADQVRGSACNPANSCLDDCAPSDAERSGAGTGQCAQFESVIEQSGECGQVVGGIVAANLRAANAGLLGF